MSLLRLSLSILFVACSVTPIAAQTAPVFHYSFSDATTLPTVIDQSAAGNNATAGPLASLSDDIPAIGVPSGSGNRSFDTSDPAAIVGTSAGAATDNTLILSNADVALARGFTYECWFRWNGGGSINSILDYAGTEKIVIDQTLVGAAGEVALRMDGNTDIPIGVAVPGEWHYVAIVFDTGGAPLNPTGTITGDVITYFDGVVPSAPTIGVTKSNFGDSLVRGIGVGMHPLGFDLDYLDGNVFEPRVMLDVVEADDLLFTATLPGDAFLRGDANADGVVDISDPVFALAALFIAGADAPTCQSAADSNDDGVFDISDAVYALAALFIPGSPPPPEPNPDCGVDPTDDPLDCVEFTPCP